MGGPGVSDEDLPPEDLAERELVNREARADARDEATYEPPAPPPRAPSERPE